MAQENEAGHSALLGKSHQRKTAILVGKGRTSERDRKILSKYQGLLRPAFIGQYD